MEVGSGQPLADPPVPGLHVGISQPDPPIPWFPSRRRRGSWLKPTKTPPCPRFRGPVPSARGLVLCAVTLLRGLLGDSEHDPDAGPCLAGLAQDRHPLLDATLGLLAQPPERAQRIGSSLVVAAAAELVHGCLGDLAVGRHHAPSPSATGRAGVLGAAFMAPSYWRNTSRAAMASTTTLYAPPPLA